MDKQKKIVIGVFVVFMGIIGFFVKSAFFTEEKEVKKEFILNTPDVEESAIDSIPKFELYNEEKIEVKHGQIDKQIFADDIVTPNENSSDSDLPSFNPFSSEDNELQNNLEGEITEEEQLSAEQELMALLKAQAEIDAKAQDDLLKTPSATPQYATQYVPEKTPVSQPSNSYNQNAAPVEAEPVKPPSLSEKWAKIDERKNSFKGIGGMSNESKSKDLTPAESVDKGVLKINSTVAFRLKEALFLPKQNLHIPKDAVLYGKTSFGGLDRMLINISTYKTNRKIYPISLEIYDFDGRPGIHLGNNSLPKIPARVAKEVFNYVQQKGTQQPAFGGDNNINPDEVKTIAQTSTVNEILEEYVNKKRVFMPQKYHVWIHISD